MAKGPEGISKEKIMKRQYIAIVTGKDGRRLYQSAPHETREAAKAEAFAARPRARRCSTGHGFGGSFGIRWHDRDASAKAFLDITGKPSPFGKRAD